MSFLSENFSSELENLCRAGDALAESKRYAEACKVYWAAWDLLPEPRIEWEAATWILSAVGDSHFLNGDYSAGRDALLDAMCCPGGIGNSFIHLRLGQCQFELGSLDRAADELIRAYMGAGKNIFEDEDPKYFLFLQSKAKDL
ncbi:MAG: tetratricopeptide repeat protein [Acidobacteria bacterium]|nr:tetratricopeptide repeat protein [Acidobacteriota bacterium]